MVGAVSAEVTNNGRIKRKYLYGEQDAAARAKILTRYALDIIKTKQWKKHNAALTVKMQNVLKAVLLQLIFRRLLNR